MFFSKKHQKIVARPVLLQNSSPVRLYGGGLVQFILRYALKWYEARRVKNHLWGQILYRPNLWTKYDHLNDFGKRRASYAFKAKEFRKTCPS